MGWSFSVKLMPGEEVVEEGGKKKSVVKAEHTPIITNYRVMFKFNTLSSGLVQSFGYDEITDAKPTKRLMIRYLLVNVCGREHYLKVDDPEVWAEKILEYKEKFKGLHAGTTCPKPPSTVELLDMIDKLHDAGVLTDEEIEEKRSKVTG